MKKVGCVLVDITYSNYLSFDLVLSIIDSVSLFVLDKKITNKINIVLVDNVDFLARTGFNENSKAIAMEINRKITKINLKKVFVKVILHEIAHIVAESKYGYSGHGEKYKHTCMLLGIPYYEKIKLTKEEMEDIK